MAIKNSSLKTMGAHPFPEDNISPRTKEGKGFGLDIALAIWGYASSFDTHLFYNDREKYRIYRDYALGRQGEAQYKPLFNEENTDNKSNWLKAIDFRIKNYATKRINITVSKMVAKDYDVVVDMVDPTSRGILENVKRSMQMKMKNKEKLQEMDRIMGEREFENIPDNQEELDIIMETDFKMIEAVHLEKAIPHHLKANRHEDIRPLVNFDIAVLGVGAIYSGMDENLRPYVERVNPADIIAPYNENPNMEDLPYIARIKWVSIAEFRKMAIGYISESRIAEIIEEFSKKQFDVEYGNSNLRRYDDVAKIALLHYNYKSTDTMVFLEKEDEFGNTTTFEKEIDYYARPKEMDKFRAKFGNSRTIHKTTINAVYEGFWVIGSEEDVFRHGRRSYSTDAYGVFNSTGMGFKVFAPNSWDGYITSMAAQMIPNLNELQRYNLKLQQLVARAIPKGIGIDLFALRKADLKWGNKSMTDQQKIEMFMKSGIFAFSSQERFAPGSNYKPFHEIENGMANDVEKYLLLTQSALNELDEIIGINKVVAASNIKADAGKAVSELQVGASEVALDYLYKADKKIYNQVVQDVGRLHVQSYRYSKKNQVIYDAMFGQSGMAQGAIRFDLFEYGFSIESRPTAAEWQEIYLGAEKAYDKGIISYSDTLFLREFKSIKQARLWLMMKEKIAAQNAQKAKQADIQDNASVQQQSLQSKGKIDQETNDQLFQQGIALEVEKRKTLTHAAQVELNKEQKIIAMQGEVDRRETAQEGKIKDRHIESEGDIDKEIASKRSNERTKSVPSDKK